MQSGAFRCLSALSKPGWSWQSSAMGDGGGHQQPWSIGYHPWVQCYQLYELFFVVSFTTCIDRSKCATRVLFFFPQAFLHSSATSCWETKFLKGDPINTHGEAIIHGSSSKCFTAPVCFRLWAGCHSSSLSNYTKVLKHVRHFMYIWLILTTYLTVSCWKIIVFWEWSL